MGNRGLRFGAKLCVWLAVLACVAGGSVASGQGQAPIGAATEQPASRKVASA